MSEVPGNGRSAMRVIGWIVARWRQFTLGSVSATLVTFMVAFLSNYDNVATSTCTLAAMQPELADTCGALGLGNQPTSAERLFWQSRRPGVCEDVRRYVDLAGQHQFRGAYFAEANALLAAKRVTPHDRFVPGTRLLSLYVMASDTAAANETDSHAKTLALAQDQSERACRAFAQTTLFKFTSASVNPQRWQCHTAGKGTACSLEGQSICHLLERQAVETESCGR